MRKMLLPVRRSGSLSVSGDGRFALGFSSVVSVVRASRVGRNAGAQAVLHDNEGGNFLDELSAKLLDPGLVRASKCFPAAIGHDIVCDTLRADFADSSHDPLEKGFGAALVSAESDDVHDLSWSPVSAGPALAFVDGNGSPRFFLPDLSFLSKPLSEAILPSENLLRGCRWQECARAAQFDRPVDDIVGKQSAIPSTSTRITADRAKTYEGAEQQLQPHDVLCMQFLQFGVPLVALGSKTGLSLWTWPEDLRNANLERIAVIHDDWTKSIAWHPLRDLFIRGMHGSQRKNSNTGSVEAYLAAGMDAEICVYLVRVRLESNTQVEKPAASVFRVWASGRNTLVRNVVSGVRWWSNDTSGGSHSDDVLLSLACTDMTDLVVVQWKYLPSTRPGKNTSDQSDSSRSVLLALCCQSLGSVRNAPRNRLGDPAAIFIAKDAHNTTITALSFTSGGHLISAATDGYVRIWQESVNQDVSGCSKSDTLRGDLSCVAQVRTGSADTEVYGLAVSCLGLCICVLLKTAPLFNEEKIEKYRAQRKFLSSSRRSRLAVHVASLQKCSEEQNFESDTVVFSVCASLLLPAFRRLVWAHRRGNALVAWDLRLWIETLPIARKTDAVCFIWQRLEGSANYLGLCEDSSATLLFARVVACLSRVVVQYASQCEMHGVVASATQVYCLMQKVILLSHCNSLAEAFLEWPGSLIWGSFGKKAAIPADTPILSCNEKTCLSAVCKFVEVCTTNEIHMSASPRIGDNVRKVQETLRMLDPENDGRFECPICAEDRLSDSDLTLDLSGPDLLYRCSRGDSFPVCMLTMRPCYNVVPLYCSECGSSASYNERNCNSMTVLRDNRPEFSWHKMQSHCPLCCSVLELSTFDELAADFLLG